MDFTSAQNISAFSSLILVVATIIYVAFTYKLFSETKKLREIETSPFISLELSPFRSSIYLSLKIKNIGKSPAYNISFEIDENFTDIFQFNFDNKIKYFAPHQEIEAIGKTYKNFVELDIDNIPIKVIYYSRDKIKHEEMFIIEWTPLNGILLEDDPLNKIENHLKNISNNFEKFVKTTQNNNELIERISIVGIEKKDFSFICIFSNGYIGKIENKQIKYIGLNNLERVELICNKLIDRSTNLYFTAEEIYNKFITYENKKIKYK